MNARIDVIVVGAGGAGLAAAISARDQGASVLVVEAAPNIGGTYAYSTGLVWCPANHPMLEAGFDDSPEEGARHVRALSGGKHDDAILDTYVEELPEALEYYRTRHDVPYDLVPRYPDYYAEHEAGRAEGRYTASPVFDTADLPQEWRDRLGRSPSYARAPAAWKEIQDWGGFGTVSGWDWDLLERRMKADIVGFGTAATGYLLRAALAAGVEIATSTRVERLAVDDRRVTGVVVSGEREGEIAAGSVILACGAFDWNEEMHRRLDPHPVPEAVGAPTVDGGGIISALELGAAFATVAGQILIPTFGKPGEEFNGKPLRRLFVREPAFPGGIIVNGQAKRFCDESFYRAIVGEMTRFDLRTQTYPNGRAYFVFDEEWKNTYNLGPARPGEKPEWIKCGAGPEELAAVLDISGDALRATIEGFNADAANGVDTAFERGSTLYGRNNGDKAVTPNPCLRPLQGALYAVEITPGSVGGSAGLRFDPEARVLDWRGNPIPGLLCAGNVGANLVEGLWYNSGAANGRAFAFGRIAGATATA